MIAEVIAIIGAVLDGAGHVFVRKGLSYSNPLTATLITLFSTTLTLLILTLIFTPLHVFISKYIFIFVIVGILALILGRFFRYIGISKLGVSRATPVSSTSPLFASFLAIVFLGEKMTASILVGTLLIVSGVILLSHEKKEKSGWRKFDLIFPFLSALSLGASYTLRKFGLIYLNDPLVGATTASISALIILLFLMLSTDLRNKLELNKPSFIHYSFCGFCYAIGILMNFIALTKGDVITVTPIINSNPLFAIFFSYLFLKGIDIITFKIIIGAIMVFAGVICIVA